MSFDGAVKRAKISMLRAKGWKDQEIARELNLEPSTISYHRRVIKERSQGNDDFVKNLLNKFERELGI